MEFNFLATYELARNLKRENQFASRSPQSECLVVCCSTSRWVKQGRMCSLSSDRENVDELKVWVSSYKHYRQKYFFIDRYVALILLPVLSTHGSSIKPLLDFSFPCDDGDHDRNKTTVLVTFNPRESQKYIVGFGMLRPSVWNAPTYPIIL